MEAKYTEAIKAGIIGGVLLAGLQLISTLISLLNVIRTEDLPTDTAAINAGVGMGILALCCVLCILYIAVLLGTGVIAVRMSSLLLRDLNDAVVASGIAGAVAGLIWGVLSIILQVLSDVISPNHATIASKAGTSLASGICGVICCLPCEIVLGAALAIIGGVIYYTFAGKNQPATV